MGRYRFRSAVREAFGSYLLYVFLSLYTTRGLAMVPSQLQGIDLLRGIDLLQVTVRLPAVTASGGSKLTGVTPELLFGHSPATATTHGGAVDGSGGLAPVNNNNNNKYGYIPPTEHVYRQRVGSRCRDLALKRGGWWWWWWTSKIKVHTQRQPAGGGTPMADSSYVQDPHSRHDLKHRHHITTTIIIIIYRCVATSRGLAA